MNNEDRRVDYMRNFDDIGLDALQYFEKCLESWPDPNMTQDQRYDTMRITY